MKPVFTREFPVTDQSVDCYGRLRPSAILYFAQEMAGSHCQLLGVDWDSMAKQNLFWAVIRLRVQVTRLPVSGETVTLETWPMPTTRVAYPRATVAYDSQGQELFRVISLWVIMDMTSRAMVLPGRSGIHVDGTLRGTELAAPGSLAPREHPNTELRTVTYSCLDRNGHMNNTRYMDWVDDLLTAEFHRDHTLREFTVCFLSEARENEQVVLDWELAEGPVLQVDARRPATDVSGRHERVFSAQVLFD